MPNLAGYQPGNVLTFAAPGGGVTNGDGVQIGQIFGVAANTAVATAPFQLIVTGVFLLPKVEAQAWTEGALIYWTGTAATTVASGSLLIGCAAAVADNPSTTGMVRLNGTALADEA
jgi:predicted RecA/RadA family phage recombinase